MAAAAESKAGWQDDLYALLRKHNVTQFSHVPDAGHSRLIDAVAGGPCGHRLSR